MISATRMYCSRRTLESRRHHPASPSAEADAGATVNAEHGDPQRYRFSQHVAVFRGDAALRELDVRDVALIKIDVEGSEYEVVVGLHGTIRQSRPFVICEILPVYDETSEKGLRRRRRVDEMLFMFKELDYRLFLIAHDGGLMPLASIETHSDLSTVDYLLAPSEYGDKLEALAPKEDGPPAIASSHST